MTNCRSAAISIWRESSLIRITGEWSWPGCAPTDCAQRRWRRCARPRPNRPWHSVGFRRQFLPACGDAPTMRRRFFAAGGMRPNRSVERWPRPRLASRASPTPRSARHADRHADLAAWRHDIHAHPETAFEEKRTADFVASRLEDFGIEVHRGLAGTGVVGTLKGTRPGRRAIALRANMDALHVHEKSDAPYVSTNPGKMHACGHDGHTTMLLGAARYLAETRNFAGTVHFIFQPAEENEGGGRVMVEEGLFEKFPVEAVYGMHNWPGMPAGKFAMRAGPMMASFDIFEITVTGKGMHAALPHLGIDPMVVAAQITMALQTIASRNTSPLDSVVVSVTQIHGGDTWNVIPDQVVLRGTARTFKPKV